MLTGDGTATAAATAAQVGIDGPVLRAQQIRTDQTHPVDFGVVAEVLPEDKHHLVQRLQAAGHTVGMTGDGVNDAPPCARPTSASPWPAPPTWPNPPPARC
jgi:H+-transporting ATPase